MIYNRINITPATSPIITILNDIRNVEQNGLDISPDYQRGYIWDKEYKDQLILSIVLNYPIGNIIINQLAKPNQKNAISELVDGKQRLSTIVNFVNGDYVITSKLVHDIKETVQKIMNNDETEEMKKFLKAKSIKYKNLPQSIQNNIISYSLPVYTMTSADVFQIREFFKVLQNQDKLKAGEIINSIPDNNLSQYFEEVEKGFLEKLDYKLKRSEYDKLYYSILGMGFGKISLNTSDKHIINFVEKIKQPNDKEKELIKKLNTNLKYIINANTELDLPYKKNKRVIKLILSLCMLYEDIFKDDLVNKINFVFQVSSKLSAFGSKESDDVSFSKHFGDEYVLNKEKFTKEKAPIYREISKSFSKNTSLKDLKESLNKLIQLYRG